MENTIIDDLESLNKISEKFISDLGRFIEYANKRLDTRDFEKITRIIELNGAIRPLDTHPNCMFSFGIGEDEFMLSKRTHSISRKIIISTFTPISDLNYHQNNNIRYSELTGLMVVISVIGKKIVAKVGSKECDTNHIIDTYIAAIWEAFPEDTMQLEQLKSGT